VLPPSGSSQLPTALGAQPAGALTAIVPTSPPSGPSGPASLTALPLGPFLAPFGASTGVITGTSGAFTGSGGDPDGGLPATPLPGQVPAAPAAEGSGGSLSRGARAMGGAAAILAAALLVVAWRSRTRRPGTSFASSLTGSHPERPG